MVKVHIIEIETGLEAHALRYAAECWGAFVTVTWVGNSAQVVEFLSNKPEQNINGRTTRLSSDRSFFA